MTELMVLETVASTVTVLAAAVAPVRPSVPPVKT